MGLLLFPHRQTPNPIPSSSRVRVPFYIVVPLLILTVGIIWWSNTRHMDFLSPPSEARLEEVRAEALASLPSSSTQRDAISIKVPDPDLSELVATPPPPPPDIEADELSTPPTLDSYSDRTADGPASLIQLAAALENQGHFQRALLAYERILDLSQPEPENIQTAISNIARIRPTLAPWNSDTEKNLPITINIGTGTRLENELPPVLEEVSRLLGIASSGIITFTHQINIGRSIQADDAPIPVAVWITGPGEDPPTTDVLAFTSETPETLREDILKTSFNLIRGHLAKSTAYNPAPETIDDPLEALNTHITRLLWQEFATLLNPTP